MKWWGNEHALSWLKGKGALLIVEMNSEKRIDGACEMRGKSLTDEVTRRAVSAEAYSWVFLDAEC